MPTVGRVVHFTASVTAGTRITYTWDFGDGATATGKYVEHSYNQVGTYTVTLQGTNTQGEATYSADVQITDIPIRNLTISHEYSGTPGDPTYFTASISAGSGVTYAWTFGDGFTDTGAVVEHVYQSGDWTATVTAANTAGTVTESVVVHASGYGLVDQWTVAVPALTCRTLDNAIAGIVDETYLLLTVDQFGTATQFGEVLVPAEGFSRFWSPVIASDDTGVYVAMTVRDGNSANYGWQVEKYGLDGTQLWSVVSSDETLAFIRLDDIVATSDSVYVSGYRAFDSIAYRIDKFDKSTGVRSWQITLDDDLPLSFGGTPNSAKMKILLGAKYTEPAIFIARAGQETTDSATRCVLFERLDTSNGDVVFQSKIYSQRALWLNPTDIKYLNDGVFIKLDDAAGGGTDNQHLYLCQYFYIGLAEPDERFVFVESGWDNKYGSEITYDRNSGIWLVGYRPEGGVGVYGSTLYLRSDASGDAITSIVRGEEYTFTGVGRIDGGLVFDSYINGTNSITLTRYEQI